MEPLLEYKNKTILEIRKLLKQLEIINFKGTNSKLYNSIIKNICIIETYNEKNNIVKSYNNNVSDIKEIINIIFLYNKFIYSIKNLIKNINSIIICMSKIDTSGIINTITPLAYSNVEKQKITLISSLERIVFEISSLNYPYEYKHILLQQFNQQFIDVNNIRIFINNINNIYLSYIKNKSSSYIVTFIYEIYETIFNYIDGKKNQKIISEFIKEKINTIKDKILEENIGNIKDLKFSNNNFNLPQSMIKLNNLYPVNLYTKLHILFKEKLSIEIPEQKNNIIKNEQLFNKISKILSTDNYKIGFIILYKFVSNFLEQQIITLISDNKKYINYSNSGINKKLLDNTNTIRILENNTIDKINNNVFIYNNLHTDNSNNNIFYVLDTINNIDFRFLSSYNYGSDNVSNNISNLNKNIKSTLTQPNKNIEIYNNILNEELIKNINHDINLELLESMDTNFIYRNYINMLNNLKRISLPYIYKFNKKQLINAFKNKDLVEDITNYIINLLSNEFEKDILDQKNIVIQKELLTYYYYHITNLKKEYYNFLIMVINNNRDRIINLSRSSYYSHNQVYMLYYSFTEEILKNFISIRNGLFILIKQKIHLINIINNN